MFLAAEMTHFVLLVAVGAQRSHLAISPLLTWQPISRQTPIAEGACQQAAIDARPAEHLRSSDGEHLHPLGQPVHLNAEGERSDIDGAGILGPEICWQKEMLLSNS